MKHEDKVAYRCAALEGFGAALLAEGRTLKQETIEWFLTQSPKYIDRFIEGFEDEASSPGPSESMLARIATAILGVSVGVAVAFVIAYIGFVLVNL